MISLNQILIPLTGCVGAAAPEIVRLYKLRTERQNIPRTYYPISVLFFVLGGFVALILPATTYWGAFYAGIAFPTLISSWAGKTPKLSKALQPSVQSNANQRKFTAKLGRTSSRESNRILFREYLGALFS